MIVQMIPLGKLRIDERAQRSLKEGWVKARTDAYALDKIGVLVTSLRGDGFYYLLDGQHRTALMLAAGESPETLVQCEVFEHLTLDQEAALFLSRNDRRGVTPWYKFQVSLTALSPEELAIKALVEERGLTISNVGEGHVSCVVALKLIYERDNTGELLGRTLDLAKKAWDTMAKDTLEQNVLKGLASVLHRYNGKLNETRLVEVLAAGPAGASGLLGRARGRYKSIGRWGLSHHLSAEIVDAYNDGLPRKERLQKWGDQPRKKPVLVEAVA